MAGAETNLVADPAAAYARFAFDLNMDSVPPQVVERARLHILDGVGCALAARNRDFAHHTIAAMLALGDKGDVPVIGTSIKLSARDAATVNGILCHGLDFDDTHLGSVVHTTASLFPCAFSSAMAKRGTVGDLLVAYIAGLEVASRVGAVAKGAFHQMGFHPTSVAGVFGCAITAGKTQGLAADQLVNAQGIALSTAAGTLEFLDDGAWNKRLHPGWAAQSGIVAASLAGAGFVGVSKPYMGRFGLYRSYLGDKVADCRPELAVSGLGTVWEMEQTAIKPFSACHFTHAHIDAAILLRKQIESLSDIAHITALVPKGTVGSVCEPVDQKRRPQNDYDARFSIPFLVAAAITRGRFTLAELTDASLKDSDILAVADLVDYEIDPQSRFPEMYSGGIVITLKNGDTLKHREDTNRGSRERPLGRDEIIAKFRDNAGLNFDDDRVREIESAILTLASDANVCSLVDVLSLNQSWK